MREIITQSAIQTREDTTEKWERLFPLLVAEALTRIEEVRNQQNLQRVDYWNTYGLKTEIQLEKNEAFTDRNKYIDDLIGARLKILEKHFGIDSSTRQELRDDDERVKTYVQALLQDLYSAGVLQIQRLNMTCCRECNLVIAPDNVQPGSCKGCGGKHFYHKTVDLLVLKVTDGSKNRMLREAQTMKLGKLISDFVQNCPDNIILSKQRKYGIPLVGFDIDQQF